MRIVIVRSILITVLLSISSLLGTKVAADTASASKYRELGLLYRQQERYPEAIAALKKSVELDTENISSRVMLGWTLHLAGQDDAATVTLLQAAYRNPFNVKKAYRQALNLDPRYRDRSFLAHLKEAGFSPAQIQTAEQVLVALLS